MTAPFAPAATGAASAADVEVALDLQALLGALKPGQRFAAQRPGGSADAYLLSAVAQTLKARNRLLTIVCEQAADVARLVDECRVFQPSLRVRAFPDWETLPYDAFSPHQDLISERLETLHGLMHQAVDVLILATSTALHRLPPRQFLAAYTFFFTQGEKLAQDHLRAQLVLANYQAVSQVQAPGEFAVRGGLIDLFPMGSALPYRLELFDDTVESIRSFDVDTQRSLYPVKTLRLLPGREFPMDEESRQRFRSRFREEFEGDPTRALPYKDIGNGIPFAGVEYYLPLFFDQTATLFDYLPEDSVLSLLGAPDAAIERFTQDTENRWRFLKSDRERPVLPPAALFLDQSQFFASAKSFTRLALSDQGMKLALDSLPAVAVDRHRSDPFEALRGLCADAARRVVVCADSEGRHEILRDWLRNAQFDPQRASTLADALQSTAPLSLCVAPLSQGFCIAPTSQALVTESDLFGQHNPRRRQRRQESASNIDAMIRDLSELALGDPVVHTQHGVGRYEGLVTLDLGEGDTEFLSLRYAGEAQLYVPVAQLHCISRYSGADTDSAPLHTLGAGQWEKARKKAAQQAHDTAAELLDLYAQRAARPGFSFDVPQADYETFVEGFGFEETPDQSAAIEAVLNDMRANKPMDRLVCGDVGFGKTEVALRAAFLAVSNNRQVVLLCPTTLLAEQHFQTFSNRFAHWPVRLVELSRFQSAKQSKAALELISNGQADIVIGTHKVLSAAVSFSRLGLVIIDEEHRFGVRQKEALKAMRAHVDVLTLTATPIPRTLGLSLEGIRDFSVIATAPQKRLAIKTFVRRESDGVIREALLRELKRGGQIYFLHNEVDTILNRRERLQALLPEARIGIAHGQLPERELEAVMRGFYQQRYNVLLCTTIIETGIDVPSANTIVIHRADRFGLAQLHQLRGRVGRSHHQAYAYLLIPGEDAITSNARKRLDAIQSMEELGSGFYLAMHDLEIRGAGEVLGDQQSGDITEVGFQLYLDLLNQAVQALRSGKTPDLNAPLKPAVEVNLHQPALLPVDYCGDVHQRLSLYKRLAHAPSYSALSQLKMELVDRYGKLPAAAQALFEAHKLRLAGEALGATKIDLNETQLTVQFGPASQIDSLKVIQLIQQDREAKLAGKDRIRLVLKRPDLPSRIQETIQRLNALAISPAPVNALMEA